MTFTKKSANLTPIADAVFTVVAKAKEDKRINGERLVHFVITMETSLHLSLYLITMMKSTIVSKLPMPQVLMETLTSVKMYMNG